MRTHANRSHRRQAGLTLVELMVAVAIGLFLLAGFTGSFVSMKRAFISQDKLAEHQDNERLALVILTNAVQGAGYFPDPLTSTAAAQLPASKDPTYGDFADGQGLVGMPATASSGQTLTTRHVAESGGALTDCIGRKNTSGSPVLVTNTFSVGPDKELLCSLDGGKTTTALVSNVTSLSVLYGTDSTGEGRADRYLAADAMSPGLWPLVRTVRITVTFGNPFAGEPRQPATIDWVQTINLMNKT